MLTTLQGFFLMLVCPFCCAFAPYLTDCSRDTRKAITKRRKIEDKRYTTIIPLFLWKLFEHRQNQRLTRLYKYQLRHACKLLSHWLCNKPIIAHIYIVLPTFVKFQLRASLRIKIISSKPFNNRSHYLYFKNCKLSSNACIFSIKKINDNIYLMHDWIPRQTLVIKMIDFSQ